MDWTDPGSPAIALYGARCCNVAESLHAGAFHSSTTDGMRLAYPHTAAQTSRRCTILLPVHAAQPMTAKKKTVKLLKCPTCGMMVRPGDEDFPFCSDRCRKIDLGKWAMGVYKISSPVLDPEVLEDLGELGGSGTPRGGGSNDR